MFRGDHNLSANGAVTPSHGSDSPSDGSRRRTGLVQTLRFNRLPRLLQQTAESASISRRTLQPAAATRTHSSISAHSSNLCSAAVIVRVKAAIKSRAYTLTRLELR